MHARIVIVIKFRVYVSLSHLYIVLGDKRDYIDRDRYIIILLERVCDAREEDSQKTC